MKKQKERPVKSVKEKITDMFEMPNDVTLGSPKVTVIGDNQLTIENYNGLLEYTSELVRVRTSAKMITVTGQKLNICTITDSDIFIEGIIECVRWE